MTALKSPRLRLCDSRRATSLYVASSGTTEAQPAVAAPASRLALIFRYAAQARGASPARWHTRRNVFTARASISTGGLRLGIS